jgi:hypothetical protein
VPGFETVAFIVLGLLAWLWINGLKVRDEAVRAVRTACESEGLLLLDDTVSLAGMAPARNSEGRLQLRRTYDFEYSDTGDNRRRGSVIMLGVQVILINVGLRLVPDDRTLH